jgi:hypothetical protein
MKPRDLEGFVYVADEEAGGFAGVEAGATVRNPTRAPPWIVVDHRLDAVAVTRWPGRVWRVRVVDADLGDQIVGVPYTRAFAVHVLEAVPVAALFGAHGAAIVELLAQAALLDRARAERIDGRLRGDAGDAYSAAWNAWLAGCGVASAGPAPDHHDTLHVSGPPGGSPINHGFFLVCEIVTRRARALDGDAAFAHDEEGPYLTAPWSGASTAALHAAMALGAPQCCTEAQRRRLLSAWLDG